MENAIIVKWIGNMLFANIKGKVIHALNGDVVSGATVQLRKGWNNTTGSYVADLFGSTKKATTSSTGEFELSVGVGIYTAEITKNGFVTGYYNVVSTTGNNSNVQTMVLTPVLQDDEYRIVLTWGDTPSDLDSHLSYYKNDVRMFHVYYSNKLGYIDGEKIAQLDLDDTTSYGPETVTLTLSVDQLQGGKFIYSVHDFTNRNSSSSKAMSLSGAMIRVYCGNDLIQTYNIPQNVSGTVWRVFEITQDGITTLNEFDNISTPSSAY